MAKADSAQTGREGADELLAFHIASGLAIDKAAQKAGVSASTAYRRWADPTFRRRVLALRSDIVGESVGRLSALMTAAAETMGKLLRSKNQAIALGAAKAILSTGFVANEQQTLAARLDAIEEALAKNEGGKRSRGDA